MRHTAPADEPSLRDRMMGRAERTCREEPPIGGKETSNAPDGRGLERLLERERRKDAGDPAGKHRLSAAGRAQHQDVVAPAGCDLERPLGVGLTADLGEVQSVEVRLIEVPTRWPLGSDVPLAVDVLDRVVQGCQRDGPDARDDRGFAGVRDRHEQVHDPPSAMQCHRKHAPNRPNAAVQGELPDDQGGGQAAWLDQAGRRQNAQRHGQVERGTRLPYVGGSKVHRDALERELESGVLDGGPDAIAAFPHAGVGQADRREGGQARGDVYLDRHDGRLDAADRCREHTREHSRKFWTAGRPGQCAQTDTSGELRPPGQRKPGA
jgi:hypothetical protein